MQSPIISNNAKGFTLLELVIASTILSLFVSGITLGSFRSIARTALTQEHSTLYALLLEARTRALVGASSYGVFITDTDFVLFPDTYESDNETNKRFPRTTGIISGATMVRFEHRSGDLLDTETTTFTIENEHASYALTINRYGVIDTN